MSIKVLVVDDSAVVRQVLTSVLNNAPDIEVYDVAPDPIFAEAKMQKHWPDVIVLDIEMPRMDGITFLKKIMQERPTPVVICSSLAEKGTELSLNALAAGAVDIITKPQLGVKNFLNETEKEIRNIIRAASNAKLSSAPYKIAQTSTAQDGNFVQQPTQVFTDNLVSMTKTTDRIIAIGTSTGGTQALETILTQLPRTCPGLVIVQHMPAKFTAAFAKRLDSICQIDVLEAESGDRILPGKAFIAPGGLHLEVQRSGAQYITKVSPGPAVNRHCPSVDVLFRSVAKNVQQNAMGIIMTGMGDDGAQGLLAMKKSGAKTIAQNEQSCIVYGMPKEAIKLEAADLVVDLNEIASLIIQ